MGWRADQAYEEAQRKAFLEWKASLTWLEYLAWWWGRRRHFLTGAAMGLVSCGVLWWIFS